MSGVAQRAGPVDIGAAAAVSRWEGTGRVDYASGISASPPATMSGPPGMDAAQSTPASTRSAGSPYYVSEPARSPLGTFPRSRDRPAGSRPEPPRQARRLLWTSWGMGGRGPLNAAKLS